MFIRSLNLSGNRTTRAYAASRAEISGVLSTTTKSLDLRQPDGGREAQGVAASSPDTALPSALVRTGVQEAVLLGLATAADGSHAPGDEAVTRQRAETAHLSDLAAAVAGLSLVSDTVSPPWRRDVTQRT
jgi:hypothetical protein